MLRRSGGVDPRYESIAKCDAPRRLVLAVIRVEEHESVAILAGTNQIRLSLDVNRVSDERVVVPAADLRIDLVVSVLTPELVEGKRRRRRSGSALEGDLAQIDRSAFSGGICDTGVRQKIGALEGHVPVGSREARVNSAAKTKIEEDPVLSISGIDGVSSPIVGNERPRIGVCWRESCGLWLEEPPNENAYDSQHDQNCDSKQPPQPRGLFS